MNTILNYLYSIWFHQIYLTLKILSLIWIDDLWPEEAEKTYCQTTSIGPFNPSKYQILDQSECQKVCIQYTNCVGIAYEYLYSNDLSGQSIGSHEGRCYFCWSDDLTSATWEVGFYRKPDITTIKPETTSVPCNLEVLFHLNV